MKRIILSLRGVVAVVLMFAGLLTSPAAEAVTPRRLPVAGVLLDAAGEPVNDTKTLRLALFGDPVGGEPIIEESHVTPIENGYFSVMLGSPMGIAPEALAGLEGLYLEVQVEDDEPMTPRIEIGTVPYAMDSATLDNRTAEQLINDASTATRDLLGGLSDNDPSTLPLSWRDVSSVPDGFADGTDDVRSDADILTVVAAAGYVTDIELSRVLDDHGFLTEQALDALLANRDVLTEGDLQWENMAGMPAGFADGIDDGLTLNELDTALDARDLATNEDIAAMAEDNPGSAQVHWNNLGNVPAAVQNFADRGAVATDQIADGAVTETKLSADVRNEIFRNGDVTPGTLAGSVVAEATSAPHVAIPDAGDPIADVISIDTDIIATDVAGVEVSLRLTHPYRGDLIIDLTSPAGLTVRLHEQAGGDADDVVGTYPTTIESAWNLAGIAGSEAAGDWVLTVQDTGPSDVGTLEEWGIRILAWDLTSVHAREVSARQIAASKIEAVTMRANWLAVGDLVMPDRTLPSAALVDGPGLNWALLGLERDLRTQLDTHLTLEVAHPGHGFILATATGTFGIDPGRNAGWNAVYAYLTTAQGVVDEDHLAAFQFHWSSNHGFDWSSFTIQRVVEVLDAGRTTLYLTGQKSEATDTARIYKPKITAIFVPTRYQ